MFGLIGSYLMITLVVGTLLSVALTREGWMWVATNEAITLAVFTVRLMHCSVLSEDRESSCPAARKPDLSCEIPAFAPALRRSARSIGRKTQQGCDCVLGTRHAFDRCH
jgi:hypothetical protein